MRMRIRTVKPEFFQHEDLYDAERETGLPLRVAYAGLWCAADREGRFPWRPRLLKVNILPYDDVQFSRVLDALWTRGFLVKYASNGGEEYGLIHSFTKHQSINNREAESELPAPDSPNVTIEDPTGSTRAPRVDDACPTRTSARTSGREGKGREGKGREGNNSIDAWFASFRKEYPKRSGSDPVADAKKRFKARLKDHVDPERLIEQARAYRIFCEATGKLGTEKVAQMRTWLGPNYEGWNQDWTPPQEAQSELSYDSSRVEY